MFIGMDMGTQAIKDALDKVSPVLQSSPLDFIPCARDSKVVLSICSLW